MTDEPTLADYIEYCQTQARLLTGRVQHLDERASELLDGIAADTETARNQLRQAQAGDETETDPETTVSAIEQRQATVEELQAKMSTYSEVAAGYTELASALQADTVGATRVLQRVVEFELAHDAPSCFDDRTTLAQQVADTATGSGSY